jgi:hypothetical protein
MAQVDRSTAQRNFVHERRLAEVDLLEDLSEPSERRRELEHKTPALDESEHFPDADRRQPHLARWVFEHGLDAGRENPGVQETP